MNFTHPFPGISDDRALEQEDMAKVLRLDAAAELDAINLYQAHIDAIADPEIRRVIESVQDDEKQHLAEFLTAVKKLDPVQAQEFNLQMPPRVMATIDGTDIDARLQALDARVRAIDDQLFSVPTVLSQAILQKGIRSNFHEVTPTEFIAARAGSKRPEMLTPYSPSDMSSMQTFLSSDGNVGYALTPDGDLVNVFNNSGQPGAGQMAVIDAIKRGANTLDAFAGFLPHYYATFGFHAYQSDAWNDDYAPPGWNYATMDRPDIIYMRYEGGPRDTIERRIGTFSGYAYPWYTKTAANPPVLGGRSPSEVRPGMVRPQQSPAGFGMGLYSGARSRWEHNLRQEYGQEWLDRNKARLDAEWDYIQELGGSDALPQTYDVDLPGTSPAEWVSGALGSPGIEVQPELATAEPCIRLNLGEGFTPLVYAKGVVGALNESQISRYCTKGFIDREGSPKQRQRLIIMSNAAQKCHAETEGSRDTEEHLARYFSCLGRELKAKGVEV